MKKLNLSALLLGAALFTGLGAVSLTASDAKCGAGKCGSKAEKPAKKCGAAKCVLRKKKQKNAVQKNVAVRKKKQKQQNVVLVSVEQNSREFLYYSSIFILSSASITSPL